MHYLKTSAPSGRPSGSPDPGQVLCAFSCLLRSPDAADRSPSRLIDQNLAFRAVNQSIGELRRSLKQDNRADSLLRLLRSSHPQRSRLGVHRSARRAIHTAVEEGAAPSLARQRCAKSTNFRRARPGPCKIQPEDEGGGLAAHTLGVSRMMDEVETSSIRRFRDMLLCEMPRYVQGTTWQEGYAITFKGRRRQRGATRLRRASRRASRGGRG